MDLASLMGPSLTQRVARLLHIDDTLESGFATEMSVCQWASTQRAVAAGEALAFPA